MKTEKLSLFLVLPGTDIDKALLIAAQNEEKALAETGEILDLDEEEMKDCGYQAILMHSETENGYKLAFTKS